jgi:hypothetical protein
VLAAVTTIINIIIALFLAFWGVYIFWAPPIFSRKRLSYKCELSTPLIHESAKSDSSLTVRYGKGFGKKSLKDPYIVQIRLSNIGRRDVRSSDFDRATPLQMDLGVKIVALLKVTCSLADMPDPKVSVTERRLNVGPSLIPHRATIDFVLLVDGPCTALKPKNPLTGVGLKQEVAEERKYGLNLKDLNLKQALGWLAVAFVVWWIIEDPTGAAHVIHNIGTFLSSVSRFFASL